MRAELFIEVCGGIVTRITCSDPTIFVKVIDHDNLDDKKQNDLLSHSIGKDLKDGNLHYIHEQ
jgi:hypothetical protein